MNKNTALSVNVLPIFIRLVLIVHRLYQPIYAIFKGMMFVNKYSCNSKGVLK